MGGFTKDVAVFGRAIDFYGAEESFLKKGSSSSISSFLTLILSVYGFCYKFKVELERELVSFRPWTDTG